jgi:restriction endonuclease Mrr
MTVPTYDQFIEPILRFLAKNPDGAPAKLAHEAAASALGLTDEDRIRMLTSGTPLAKCRTPAMRENFRSEQVRHRPPRRMTTESSLP